MPKANRRAKRTPIVEMLEPRRLLTTYQVVDLGAFNGGSSQAMGINDLGQVVGISTDADGTEHAFLWQRGALTDLGAVSRANPSEANAINNLGQVAGTAFVGDARQTAALFENAGATLLNLGALAGGDSSAADVNNASVAVGASIAGNGNEHATRFIPRAGSRHSTLVTDLGTLGGAGSHASAVNDQNAIVGGADTASGIEHAFIYSTQSLGQQPIPLERTIPTMQDLGTLAGLSEATAINDANQVVGFSTRGDSLQHAFLWQNGAMQDLGALSGGTSMALGINSLGQVVGNASISGLGLTHAFIWQGGVLTDLNAGQPRVGPVITSASAINSSGDIAATIVNGSVQHAALLVPLGRGRTDLIPPTAAITSRLSPITAPTARLYTIRVTYADDVAVDVTSLDSSDILVTGPGRSRYRVNAQFVSVTPAGNGSPRVASYTIVDPRGGWTFANNAVYTITLQPNQVRDTSGNYAGEIVLGAFRVDINSAIGVTDPGPTGLAVIASSPAANAMTSSVFSTLEVRQDWLD